MSQEHAAAPIVVLTLKNRLVALNVHTGERVWEFESKDKNGYGHVRVAGQHVVYIAKGKIYNLDCYSGDLRWVVDVPKGLGSQPNLLLHAGCLVIADGGEAACLTLADGSLRWHDPFKGYGVSGGSLAAEGVASPIDRRQV